MFLFICIYIIAPLTFIGLIAYGWHLGGQKAKQQREARARNTKK